MKLNMEHEGLPYNVDRKWSYNSRLAQELSKWAETKGTGEKVTDALFRAYFVDAKNIGEPEVLARIAEENGLPPDEATDVLLSRSFKEAVDDDWRRCAAIGVNAVPTFLAGRYLLVGAHPYEHLEQLIERALGDPGVGSREV